MKYGLTFDRPSNRYDQALPIGTGRLGAMVSGAVVDRLIWINEETVWYGGPRDRINPDAHTHIEKIKQLVREKRFQEAERLAVLTLTGVPESQRHYSTLGLVALSFINQQGEITNYQHQLDFETATATTQYMIEDVAYRMTVHANQPESALIIRLTASAPVLSFSAGIERGERVAQFSYGTHMDDIFRHQHNGLIMSGSCGGKNGLEYASALFAESNGRTYLLGDKVVVEEASEAVLYISAATTYNTEHVIEHVINQAIAARVKGYVACYQNHLDEWQPLYTSAGINLETTHSQALPSMNELFDAIENEQVAELDCVKQGMTEQALFDYLIMLLFHYGRYILLSCSRKCDLPASLQGIWSRDLLPVWDSKFTTNINLQMAYWSADSANMSECIEPYIQLAERVRESGLVTARRMYNCRGFVLHNNTDIWADTAVQDSGSHCSYWFLGGVWIAADMFEHFRYTKDTQFLQRIWPIMRDASLFVLDFMDETTDNHMVMGVTTSPENIYYDSDGQMVSFCEMSAMDAQLITLLLNDCVQATDILTESFGGFDADLNYITEVKRALTQIEPTKIAIDGTILEWSVEVKEAELAHRHSSQLIGAYPYNNITEHQPVLFKAVDMTVNKRMKDKSYRNGWGYAWGAGTLARLKRGNDAREMFIQLLENSCQPNLLSCCNISNIPKLLDTDKPMQVDGTIGMVQAVVELLLQSYNDDELQILPSLPDSWHTGSFSKLVARGNIVVDAQWHGGKLTEAVLMPRIDTAVTIVCQDDFYLVTPTDKVLSSKGKITARLSAGTTYQIYRA